MGRAEDRSCRIVRAIFLFFRDLENWLSSRVQWPISRPSNPRIPFIIVAILPEAAFSVPQAGEAVARFDPHQIFGLLVAELALDAQAQRRAVGDLEVAVVERPGEDGLGMEGVDQVDAL